MALVILVLQTVVLEEMVVAVMELELLPLQTHREEQILAVEVVVLMLHEIVVLVVQEL